MPDERTSKDVHGSSAHICRELGWYGGTYVRAELPPTVLRITAVGEEQVLACQVFVEGGQPYEYPELQWLLTDRNWRKIAPLVPEETV